MPHFRNNNTPRCSETSRFYRMDDLVSNSNITPSYFKSLYPLFVTDFSKQSERLKNSITDIQIEAAFNENVPTRTNYGGILAQSILAREISSDNRLRENATITNAFDRVMRFVSDGNKMSVIT